MIFDEVMLKMTEQDVPALQQIGADVIYQAAKRHQPFKVRYQLKYIIINSYSLCKTLQRLLKVLRLSQNCTQIVLELETGYKKNDS